MSRAISAPRDTIGTIEDRIAGADSLHRSTAAASDARLLLWLLLLATAVPLVALPLSTVADGTIGSLFDARVALVFLGSGVHVAASFRFYWDAAFRPLVVRSPGRFVVAPLALIGGTAAGLTMVSPAGAAKALVLYFAWQTHHYTRQNVGILAFSAKACGGARPSALERATVTTAGVAGVLGMFTFITPYVAAGLGPIAWYLDSTARIVFVAALAFMVAALPRAARTGGPWRVVFLILC